MAAKPKPSGFQKFQKGTPPKSESGKASSQPRSGSTGRKGGALPPKVAKPIKGKNRKGSK
jgi:hypothetical protein